MKARAVVSYANHTLFDHWGILNALPIMDLDWPEKRPSCYNPRVTEGIMLAVADALQLVLARCRPLPPLLTPLIPDALGRVLAEDVASDLDMPPFDKALMDGYAVRAADIGAGRAVLPVAAEVMAGQTP